ncbi:MAG: hypothetical protein IKD09_01495 [Lentisphaeria bacterium]|nr:hypothetical protein [Lentisphaeria bacterium]
MFTEKIFAVIDTETQGGATDPYCPAYHLGAIALSRKEIKNTLNVVILENLQMDSAFYGKSKKEFYRELLKNPNTIICYTEAEAKEVFSAWLNKNNVSCVCAYNSGFDFCRTLVKDCIEGMEFFDIQFAFFDTVAQTKKYKEFCADNRYYTPSKNCRMTAEICYRFLINDTSFIEEHTALADCEIEAEILRACWNTHKGFTRNAHKGDYIFLQVKCPVKKN